MKLKKIEPTVKEVLQEQPLTRADDFLLIAEVYSRLVPESVNMPFSVVMLTHKKLGLPYFETIRRTRQKLQADNEELRPSKEAQYARYNETANYIDYAINGYSSNFMDFVNSQE